MERCIQTIKEQLIKYLSNDSLIIDIQGITADNTIENERNYFINIAPNNILKIINKKKPHNIILISQGDKSNGDKINTGVRLSFGRSFGETWPGYLFSEITNSFWIKDNIILNFTPKSAWTGEGNLFAIGTGINWKLNDYFYIIPESNIAISDSETNWTFALRSIPKEYIYIDLYTTNALNFTDIGELIKAKSQSIGLKTAILF